MPLALALWAAAAVAVGLRVAMSPPDRQSVYPIFLAAASSWQHGECLYLLPGSEPGKPVYRYSPLVGAAFVPLAQLPHPIGAILWRSLNLGMLLAAFAGWATWAASFRSENRPDLGLLLLLMLPLTLGNLNNGQANPLVLGLLLGTMLSAARGHWALAGCCSAGAGLVKIYPLALALLLLLIAPRRLAGWVLAFLAAGLLLPFALQDSGYVAGQYVDWLYYLRNDDRSGWSAVAGYRDLRLLLGVWLFRLDNPSWLALQLAGAASSALIILMLSRRGWPRHRLLTVLFALAAGWMTLLGPCTESSTWMLLAPSLSWALAESWNRAPSAGRWFLLAAYGMFLGAGVAAWFPGGAAVHALGVQPLAGVFFLLGLGINEATWFRESRGDTGTETAGAFQGVGPARGPEHEPARGGCRSTSA
jgi:hypothetical protein